MNQIKKLKEEINELLSQKVELRMSNGDMTEVDELLANKREELRGLEEELKQNSIQEEIQTKGNEKEMNLEFREAMRKGEELANFEVRENEGVHHVMGTMTGGSDMSAQRVETLQQTILRKMAEDAVLVQYIPFTEQQGKLRIPVSSNKAKAVKVGEGEVAPLKNYSLSYLNADVVKYMCQSVLTNELLEDSQLALMNFVTDELVRDFNRALQFDFLQGNIEGKCEGIAVSTKAKTTTVAVKDSISVVDVKNAYFNMPVAVRNANDLLFICPTSTVKMLDLLEDANGRALLHPQNDAQMNGKYFDKLYNARVVEVELDDMPTDVMGVFVSPSMAVHAGIARQMNIKVDNSKRSEYDEQVVIASLRCGFVVKDGDAISILKNQTL